MGSTKIGQDSKSRTTHGDIPWDQLPLDMIDVGEVYGRNDWTYAHLDGREVTLTITSLRVVMVPGWNDGDDEKPKIELTFAESARTYVPGKEVIYRHVVPAWGSKAERWVGQRVTLYPDTWQNGGRSGTRIGIRPAGNDQPSAASSKGRRTRR